MLAENEAQYVDEERPETRDAGWRIDDLADADWALMRIAQLEAEKAEIADLAKRRIEEIRLRADALAAKSDRGVRFFVAHLRQYAETHKAELLKGGKAKSRTLIHGRIGWTKRGGDPVVRDAEALEAWALQQSPETGFLRVKSEPAWDSIKQHIKNTGEVVPGVELSEEVEEFQVKAGGKTK